VAHISKSLQALLAEIYDDDHVSMDEFLQLQDDSDRRWDNVVTELGANNTLLSFQKAMDVAMHLLYLGVEHIKEQELTDLGEAIVKDAVTAQVEAIRAASELSLKALKVGRNTL
jgi:predicted transcriptional regulator